MTDRTLRVLVADDEVNIADTLASILKLNGFDATAVHSGEEAVELASTFRPDAAILDVMLGGITGIETAYAILRELPACRIVLFSGYQKTADLLAEAAALGHIFDVYAKPVHPQTLIDALGPLPPAPGLA
jgi:CheY-like chemotaxis protein